MENLSEGWSDGAGSRNLSADSCGYWKKKETIEIIENGIFCNSILQESRFLFGYAQLMRHRRQGVLYGRQSYHVLWL